MYAYINKFLRCDALRIIVNHIDDVRSLSHVEIRNSDRSRALKLNIAFVFVLSTLVDFYQPWSTLECLDLLC